MESPSSSDIGAPGSRSSVPSSSLRVTFVAPNDPPVHVSPVTSPVNGAAPSVE